ncbi:MAG TPA: hypothetical protein VJ044_08390 [Candidatus Hodarchaeales archaeon]|nr:hypothetical protein [Candidatus Hodarchaeales archaeon]
MDSNPEFLNNDVIRHVRQMRVLVGLDVPYIRLRTEQLEEILVLAEAYVKEHTPHESENDVNR